MMPFELKVTIKQEENFEKTKLKQMKNGNN